MHLSVPSVSLCFNQHLRFSLHPAPSQLHALPAPALVFDLL